MVSQLFSWLSCQRAPLLTAFLLSFSLEVPPCLSLSLCLENPSSSQVFGKQNSHYRASKHYPNRLTLQPHDPIPFLHMAYAALPVLSFCMVSRAFYPTGAIPRAITSPLTFKMIIMTTPYLSTFLPSFPIKIVLGNKTHLACFSTCTRPQSERDSYWAFFKCVPAPFVVAVFHSSSRPCSSFPTGLDAGGTN